MAKIVIGEWHDTRYTGEIWKRCSECKCETRKWKDVVRPAFARVMCPECLNAFLEIEEMLKCLNLDVLTDWWMIQAIT